MTTNSGKATGIYRVTMVILGEDRPKQIII